MQYHSTSQITVVTNNGVSFQYTPLIKSRDIILLSSNIFMTITHHTLLQIILGRGYYFPISHRLLEGNRSLQVLW